jgi:hypothetical protein
MYYKLAFILATLALCVSSSARAGEKPAGESKEPGSSLTQISPVFSQLVMFSTPKGFKPVFENSNGNRYIRESVLDGETVDEWSQMITVTGAKGLAADPNVTPQLFVTQIGAGFRRACPDTFSAKPLGAAKITGQDAFLAVVGCGTVLAKMHSEVALIIAIKGSADDYTIQWAERGPASTQPVAIDSDKWIDRLRSLSPIKICPLVPSEAPPYPSCLNH